MARYSLDYDREYSSESRPWRRWSRLYPPFGRAPYDDDFRTSRPPYDHDFQRPGDERETRKTRWDTDYGDPFRDRERGTPFRAFRGRWRTPTQRRPGS